MSRIINIRGPNGSGKSTVARSFMPEGSELTTVDLVSYLTKRNQPRMVKGYRNISMNTIIVGDYSTMAGGLDKVPNFETSRRAIREAAMLAPYVVCEGVLASTVYSSWAAFDDELKLEAHTWVWAYLQTPLEECLRRIRERQEASGKVRDIKEDLVADKVKAVASTRRKAIADRRLVYDLPLEQPERAAQSILWDGGEDEWLAR